MKEDYCYWHHWTSIYAPGKQSNMPPGIWRIKLFIDDKPFDSLTFRVES